MKLTGIHHCAVVVHDVEQAIAFYRDVLGLQEISIPTTFPGAGLHVRWFEIGDQQIHLIPAAEPDAAARRHVALHIDDARAAREELQQKGVEVRETVPIPGADRFFVTDPAGNRIELIEWKEAYQGRAISAAAND